MSAVPRSFVGAFAVAVALAPPLEREARADVAGLNMGAPVWHGVPAEDALQAAIGTGGHYVRVNFRLDDWSSPTDTTLHGGKTWFDVYDHVVDSIVSQGLEVYGLLNDEITTGFSRPYDTPEFEDAYAANALAVIDRYKDRVRVFETINEPNDWAGGSSARMPADVFARVHARLYDEVKNKHAGDACWDQIRLVTGPLFSFDDNPSDGYLDAVIASGRGGGTWATLRAAMGHDPIDGVGYHVYVAQGESSPASDVAAKGGANLDAVDAVLAKYGIATQLWVSEIGWEVDPSYVTEATQASRLDATWSAFGARDDVASLMWFTLGDFPGGPFGLYRLSGFTPADQRPSWSRFVEASKAHAPQLSAMVGVDLPSTVVAGSRVVAHVGMKNLGLEAWSAADGVRLGAAPGCPSAWATNDWTWDDPGAANGYVKSAVDARVFLYGGVVMQGATTDLDVALTAPSTPGKKRFAVRMVKEGVSWFGATAWRDVDVVAPGADVGVDASAHDAGRDAFGIDAPDGLGGDAFVPAAELPTTTGCECRASAPASESDMGIGMVVGLGLALTRRRRRHTR